LIEEEKWIFKFSGVNANFYTLRVPTAMPGNKPAARYVSRGVPEFAVNKCFFSSAKKEQSFLCFP